MDVLTGKRTDLGYLRRLSYMYYTVIVPTRVTDKRYVSRIVIISFKA